MSTPSIPFIITVSDAGELKTITRAEIEASIREAGWSSETGMKQLDFVLNRVLGQRSAREEALAQAVTPETPVSEEPPSVA